MRLVASVCVCMYVCRYVCMYVCMYVCHAFMQHSSTFIKDVAKELSQKLQNLSAKVTTKREQIHGVNTHREKQKEQQKLAACKQEANLN